MANMGRPRIEIDYEQFEKLCAIQCTLVEIAGWFNCSEDTIEARVKEHYGETFAEVFKKKSSPGKASLRRKQFEIAQSGNVSMLIWLGKQYLGQRDKQDLVAQTTLDQKESKLIIQFSGKEKKADDLPIQREDDRGSQDQGSS